ncbi:MAG TPA: hypothetical protein VJ822_10650 [Dongiaceae bacterium]|nr:hypothetical protein [Dongiaceae bacterium]
MEENRRKSPTKLESRGDVLTRRVLQQNGRNRSGHVAWGRASISQIKAIRLAMRRDQMIALALRQPSPALVLHRQA